ncbi:homeobox protein Hox-B3 isoform X3 [Cuculus canorus]|uniref:homeobox protein Hox-B3 isoform X3 n=1 Tax=Cuculus canorus TaxID=55661 RepID=UPI0023AB40DC|nr:homeobox protein Hox-B3 isoform X3 [Cuculus canorus]
MDAALYFSRETSRFKNKSKSPSPSKSPQTVCWEKSTRSPSGICRGNNNINNKIWIVKVKALFLGERNKTKTPPKPPPPPRPLTLEETTQTMRAVSGALEKGCGSEPGLPARFGERLAVPKGDRARGCGCPRGWTLCWATAWSAAQQNSACAGPAALTAVSGHGNGEPAQREKGEGRKEWRRGLGMEFFLPSLGLIILSPGPAHSLPFGVCLFVGCFVRKKERREESRQPFGLQSRLFALCFTKIIQGKTTATLARRTKPTARRFPSPASHLASYFQKFLCFRETLSILSPLPLSPRTSSHFAPAHGSLKSLSVPSCRRGAARRGAEGRGGSQRAEGDLSSGPPSRDPHPGTARHPSRPGC